MLELEFSDCLSHHLPDSFDILLNLTWVNIYTDFLQLIKRHSLILQTFGINLKSNYRETDWRTSWLWRSCKRKSKKVSISTHFTDLMTYCGHFMIYYSKYISDFSFNFQALKIMTNQIPCLLWNTIFGRFLKLKDLRFILKE